MDSRIKFQGRQSLVLLQSIFAIDIMKNKKPLSLKKQFNEATSYLKEILSYVYGSIIIFFIGSIIGFFFRANLTFLNEILREIFLKTQGLNSLELTTFILQNNLQAALFATIFGILAGVQPIVSMISNGIIVGYVLGLSYDLSGFTQWWRLLPHGIFELPAIFISAGLGIKLGFSLFFNKEKNFKENLLNSANVFLMIVIPLLILAAIIEGILIFALA